MSDQESSTSASQTEGELEGELEGDEEQEEGPRDAAPCLSSTLRAVIRIKQKYQALKKRREELALGLGGAGTLTGAPGRTSPKIFTFDGVTPLSAVPQKKKRRRRRGVMFPHGTRQRAPPKQECSRAKYCLYLLFAIVFLQVGNLTC